MAASVPELKRLQDEKRNLEFRLIAVNSLIDKLSPSTLGDYVDFNRHRDTREHELRSLEAERDALNKQIEIIDRQISSLQLLAASRKHVSKQMPQKKLIYDRIEALLAKHPNMKKTEAIGQIADELGKNDDAVKKAYYDYAHDLQEGRGDTSAGDSNAEPDDKKSPTK